MKFSSMAWLLVAASLLWACASTGDGDGAGGAAITIDGVAAPVAALSAIREGDLYELTIAFQDGGTLVIGSNGDGPLHRVVDPSGGGRIARYTPAAGEDYTSWYRYTAMGTTILDGSADDGLERLSGELRFTLARKNDEVLRFEGPYEGVEVSAGTVALVPASLSCRIRAYSSGGGEFWGSRTFSNASDLATIVVAADISRSLGLTMFFPADIAPGRYDVAESAVRGLVRDDPYGGEGTFGMIEILDHDTADQRVSGTFAYQGDAAEPSGTMVPFLVNMGAFDVTYVRHP